MRARMQKNDHSYIASGNVLYSHSGDQFGSFFKLSIYLSYDPATVILGIYPKEKFSVK